MTKQVNAEEFDALVTAFEKIQGSNIELQDRLTEYEQKMAEGGHQSIGRSTGPNIGRMVTESPQFKSLLEGNGTSARISLKTAIVNATGASQPLVAADRLAGIVHAGERRFYMRDLIATGRTTSNTVEFAKENTFTNNAGPQVANSPQEFENVVKPESAFSFTLESAAVTTLAHWIPISKQVLADSPMLQSYINNRLLYGLKLKEDQQILLGTGANGNLPGLYTNRTAYSTTSPLTYTTRLDILRDAMSQIEVADLVPDGIVLNPVDWRIISTTTVGSGDARYVVGDPQDAMKPMLWGLPVVVTNTMAAGTFLVGAFAQAAQLWDREDASIEIGLNNDNFTRNMLTVLCEERVALTLYRATGLVGGSFTVS